MAKQITRLKSKVKAESIEVYPAQTWQAELTSIYSLSLVDAQKITASEVGHERTEFESTSCATDFASILLGPAGLSTRPQ